MHKTAKILFLSVVTMNTEEKTMHKNLKIENLSIAPKNIYAKTMDKILKPTILCIPSQRSNEKSDRRAGRPCEATEIKYKKTIKSQNIACNPHARVL